MELSTFAETGSRNVIDPDYTRTLRIEGYRLRIQLEPGCWVGNSLLAIRVRGKPGGGTYYSGRRFKNASMGDLSALFKRIKLRRCSRRPCKEPYLHDDRMKKGNPDRLCEHHRLQDINKQAASLQAKEELRERKHDAKWRSKGYRYKSTVWIHRHHADDYSVIQYFKNRPTRAELKRIAAANRSALLNDYTVEKLK